MTKDNIVSQCREMTDEALIRALSKEKKEYTEEFATIAASELAHRGMGLKEALDRVRVKTMDGDKSTVSVDEAMARLHQMNSLWDTMQFVNCLGECATVQKASQCWSGVIDSDESRHEFIVISDDGMADLLNRVLTLEDWESTVDHVYDPDNWEVVCGAHAFGFVNKLCKDMAASRIPAAIRVSRSGQKRSCGNDSCEKDEGPIQIRVQRNDMETASQALQRLKTYIDGVFDAVSALEEGEDRERELQLYNELFELMPNDESVAFNRGVMLYEDGLLEDAAESFIIAAFNRTDEEIRGESEAYLEEILAQMPDNLTILHSLASLAMEQGLPDLVETHYKKIISIDPSDTIAHLNLGHLHYAENGDDDVVKHHFETYLSIEPDGEEADEVRRILDTLH